MGANCQDESRSGTGESRSGGPSEIQCCSARHEFGGPGGDERRIEVVAQDLLCFGGAQLAVDITLRSALCATGEPQPGAAEVDGAVLVRGRRDKENANPLWELTDFPKTQKNLRTHKLLLVRD